MPKPTVHVTAGSLQLPRLDGPLLVVGPYDPRCPDPEGISSRLMARLKTLFQHPDFTAWFTAAYTACPCPAPSEVVAMHAVLTAAPPRVLFCNPWTWNHYHPLTAVDENVWGWHPRFEPDFADCVCLNSKIFDTERQLGTYQTADHRDRLLAMAVVTFLHQLAHHVAAVTDARMPAKKGQLVSVGSVSMHPTDGTGRRGGKRPWADAGPRLEQALFGGVWDVAPGSAWKHGYGNILLPKRIYLNTSNVEVGRDLWELYASGMWVSLAPIRSPSELTFCSLISCVKGTSLPPRTKSHAPSLSARVSRFVRRSANSIPLIGRAWAPATRACSCFPGNYRPLYGVPLVYEFSGVSRMYCRGIDRPDYTKEENWGNHPKPVKWWRAVL
ncbi:hypothetical protein DFJ77DRAFT_456537 [Powellomyces hirtus]|nr:hypothetical protein DFJ77DRAFT_456537 [Powellomyces hirtus]